MKSSRKPVFYDDLSFEVFENVYEPAEDTFLVADVLSRMVKAGDIVLDVGTGCGILAIIAAKKARCVVATDVNPCAVECARHNVKNNDVADRLDVRLGSLFDPLHKVERFDVIVFNPPYLPSIPEEQETWIERAWAGGAEGRQIIDQFIVTAPERLKKNGKILMVQSSLTDIDKTLKKFRDEGLKARIIAERKVPFEKLVVIQASHLSEQST